MLFQKLRPFALASLLLLACGTLAMAAEPNNPDLPHRKPAPSAGGAIALYCACVGHRRPHRHRHRGRRLLFVYSDARPVEPTPRCG